MYYSYVEIEYVATSFSPARTDLALKLLRYYSIVPRIVPPKVPKPWQKHDFLRRFWHYRRYYSRCYFFPLSRRNTNTEEHQHSSIHQLISFVTSFPPRPSSMSLPWPSSPPPTSPSLLLPSPSPCPSRPRHPCHSHPRCPHRPHCPHCPR